jgi:hypothetical protein
VRMLDAPGGHKGDAPRTNEASSPLPLGACAWSRCGPNRIAIDVQKNGLCCDAPMVIAHHNQIDQRCMQRHVGDVPAAWLQRVVARLSGRTRTGQKEHVILAPARTHA